MGNHCNRLETLPESPRIGPRASLVKVTGVAVPGNDEYEDDLWIQFIDETTGIPYYHNAHSNETAWKAPDQYLVHPSVVDYIAEAVNNAPSAVASKIGTRIHTRIQSRAHSRRQSVMKPPPNFPPGVEEKKNAIPSPRSKVKQELDKARRLIQELQKQLKRQTQEKESLQKGAKITL
mmetsp:Transcript_5136/g.7571  ORF Transcript_5136/g.7571 Transcript_5136/m.7571 type:complete len:177 (+) Transcript_5136:70-600(+)|eukprot:CAMPEP_0167757676 /NCGR_PEP_ID=MMETSP0110_2-20121227/10055_1 /TAXON_ID=629695 /ORGANISM="Gymnochlora sp., Strain CCMP2014" /LENGTH=176 /DNA_ID=CAMNT_0007643887 /DNA_START=49 /DNA_END=579 /DNA_ORIENTATION=+